MPIIDVRIIVLGAGVVVCYTDQAEQAQQHPGIKTTINPAEDNRKKQCRPNETKPNSNAIHPHKRHNNRTHSYTPSRIKSTHTRRAYTGIRPHAWFQCGTPQMVSQVWCNFAVLFTQPLIVKDSTASVACSGIPMRNHARAVWA